MGRRDIVGYAASVLASTSLIPQVVKVYKTKSAEDLSYGMIAIIMCSSLLWQIHSWLKNDVPLRIASAVTLCVNLTLLVLKSRYSKNK